MKYQKALEIVSNFMETTGIHKYCSEKCHGYCCHGCINSHEGGNYGYKTGDCWRRLACKSYLCNELREYILGSNKEWYNLISHIVYTIEHEYFKTVDINCYFHRYEESMNKLEFDDNKFKFISRISKDEVKHKIGLLNTFVYMHDNKVKI